MRLIPALAAAAVLFIAVRANAEGVPLDLLLKKPEFWSLKPSDFQSLQEARRFQWTSSARDSARAAGRDLEFLGLPVCEAVARFDGDKLNEFTTTVYARGDAGDLTKEQFETVLRATIEALNLHTKVKFAVRGKDATNAVKAEGLIWQTPAARYLLEYSFTKEMKTKDIPFRAEFIRLEITPPQRTVSLLTSATNTTRAKFNGLTHIKRDGTSGDVLIPDVPMVDQGQKGYCAVACTERVMRYYGIQTDANEIAQIANSDASGGTSADAMFGALKKLSARLHVRIHPIEQMEVKEILNLVNDYNRVAKKGNRAPAIPDPGRMIDVNAIFAAMKPDVLKETRTKNKAEISKFQRDVQGRIDEGVPLIWSVMLGYVPEPGLPQAMGGHMRLIIGYNNKTQEILYTDSWGAGHELKRMPAADAWTITTGLTTLEPL